MKLLFTKNRQWPDQLVDHCSSLPDLYALWQAQGTGQDTSLETTNIESGSPPKRLNKNNHKCGRGTYFPLLSGKHKFKFIFKCSQDFFQVIAPRVFFFFFFLKVLVRLTYLEVHWCFNSQSKPVVQSCMGYESVYMCVWAGSSIITTEQMIPPPFFFFWGKLQGSTGWLLSPWRVWSPFWMSASSKTLRSPWPTPRGS